MGRFDHALNHQAGQQLAGEPSTARSRRVVAGTLACRLRRGGALLRSHDLEWDGRQRA